MGVNIDVRIALSYPQWYMCPFFMLSAMFTHEAIQCVVCNIFSYSVVNAPICYIFLNVPHVHSMCVCFVCYCFFSVVHVHIVLYVVLKHVPLVCVVFFLFFSVVRHV